MIKEFYVVRGALKTLHQRTRPTEVKAEHEMKLQDEYEYELCFLIRLLKFQFINGVQVIGLNL